MYKVGPRERELTQRYFEARRALACAVQSGDERTTKKHRERVSELLAAARDAEKGGE